MQNIQQKLGSSGQEKVLLEIFGKVAHDSAVTAVQKSRSSEKSKEKVSDPAIIQSLRNPPDHTLGSGDTNLSVGIVENLTVRDSLGKTVNEESRIENEKTVDPGVQEELSINSDEVEREEEKEPINADLESASDKSTDHSKDEGDQKVVDVDASVKEVVTKINGIEPSQKFETGAAETLQELSRNFDSINCSMNQLLAGLSGLLLEVSDTVNGIVTHDSVAFQACDPVPSPPADDSTRVADSALPNGEQLIDYCKEEVSFSSRDNPFREFTPSNSREEQGDEIQPEEQIDNVMAEEQDEVVPPNRHPEEEIIDFPDGGVANNVSIMTAPDNRDHHQGEDLSDGYPSDPVTEFSKTPPLLMDTGEEEEESLPSFISLFSAMCPDPQVVAPCDISLEYEDVGK